MAAWPLALVLGATGCGAVDSWDKATSDAWSVTYEIEVTGATGQLPAVSYLESAKRGEPGTIVDVSEAVWVPDSKDPSRATWSVESIITAETDASLTATPAKGATATCRILLDGTKEIAARTGATGEPVECSATTPAFSGK
ncbi:hypothetical protein [Glutamicibacter sp.]|uniref:hypothetical protein n=1 Tax=Glutamicibacter sp. TaxID=1931995 RepID=UPI003D6B1370